MNANKAKKKILIIDDEEDICTSTKSILERTREFEVRFALKGGDGLDLAEVYKPDLVLLDIVLPDMDGGAVVSQLRASQALKNTRIIFISALVQLEEVQKKAGVIGGNEFISKPINGKDLVDRVKSALD